MSQGKDDMGPSNTQFTDQPDNKNADATESSNSKTLSFWQTFNSVLWAAFGVQKKQTLSRDLLNGNIPAFITAIALFLFIFIAGIATIVSLII